METEKEEEKKILGDDICTFNISKNGCQWGDKCKKIHFEDSMTPKINDIFDSPLTNLSECFIKKFKIAKNIKEYFKKQNITNKYQMVSIIIQNAIKKEYNKKNKDVLKKINIRMCRDKKSEEKNPDQKEFIEINIRFKNEESKKSLRFYYYKFDKYNNKNKYPIFFMFSTFYLNEKYEITEFVSRDFKHTSKSFNEKKSFSNFQSPLDYQLEKELHKKGIKLEKTDEKTDENIKEIKSEDICPNNSEEHFPTVIKSDKKSDKVNNSNYKDALKSNKLELSIDEEESIIDKDIKTDNPKCLQREISQISNLSELGSPIRREFPSEFNEVTDEIWKKMFDKLTKYYELYQESIIEIEVLNSLLLDYKDKDFKKEKRIKFLQIEISKLESLSDNTNISEESNMSFFDYEHDSSDSSNEDELSDENHI